MLCFEYIYGSISKFRIFFGIFIVVYFWSRKNEKIRHLNAYLITKQPSCLRKKIVQVNYDLIFLYNENKIIAPEALFLAPSSFKACKHYHFDSVLQFHWKDYVTTSCVCFPAFCLFVRQDGFVEVLTIVDFGGSGRKNNYEKKKSRQYHLSNCASVIGEWILLSTNL